MEQVFLSSPTFVVVGASKDPAKFGNKILRKYADAGANVTPVHPKEKEINGLEVKQLVDIENPETCGVSIVTPPSVTAKVIEEAIGLGFKRFWLQPGAESADIVTRLKSLDDSFIKLYGGPCVLISIDHGGKSSI